MSAGCRYVVASLAYVVAAMLNFQLYYYDVAWVGDYYFYDKINLIGAIIFMIEPLFVRNHKSNLPALACKKQRFAERATVMCCLTHSTDRVAERLLVTAAGSG